MGVLIDFTDVTLVSEDTYRRLYWCDPDDHDGYDDHDDCEVLLPWRSLDEDLPVVKEDVSGDDHKAELVDGQAGEGRHWKGQAGHLFEI